MFNERTGRRHPVEQRMHTNKETNMPISAHEFFEQELKATLKEVFGKIYDFVTSGDEWYQIGVERYGEVEDTEWKDRDGYWSHNNGGVEMTFVPSETILYNGSILAPCIEKWVASEQEFCKKTAMESEDYLEWKSKQEANGECVDVESWLSCTEGGNEFENEHKYSWMEAIPYCKVKAWLQGPTGSQYHGAVEPESILKVHFAFCFNDDLGYGRPSISYCPGVGDHPKCEIDIFFKVKDVEKVREVIRTRMYELATMPNNECHKKEEIYIDGVFNCQ